MMLLNPLWAIAYMGPYLLNCVAKNYYQINRDGSMNLNYQIAKIIIEYEKFIIDLEVGLISHACEV